jgi:hypothetical protein
MVQVLAETRVVPGFKEMRPERVSRVLTKVTPELYQRIHPGVRSQLVPQLIQTHMLYSMIQVFAETRADLDIH